MKPKQSNDALYNANYQGDNLRRDDCSAEEFRGILLLAVFQLQLVNSNHQLDSPVFTAPFVAAPFRNQEYEYERYKNTEQNF